MIAMKIILKGDKAWEDLKDRRDDIVHIQGGGELATLDGGMASGKPSVSLRLDLPDGKVLIYETSLLMLKTAVDAIVASHEKQG